MILKKSITINICNQGFFSLKSFLTDTIIMYLTTVLKTLESLRDSLILIIKIIQIISQIKDLKISSSTSILSSSKSTIARQRMFQRRDLISTLVMKSNQRTPTLILIINAWIWRKLTFLTQSSPMISNFLSRYRSTRLLSERLLLALMHNLRLLQSTVVTGIPTLIRRLLLIISNSSKLKKSSMNSLSMYILFLCKSLQKEELP